LASTTSAATRSRPFPPGLDLDIVLETKVKWPVDAATPRTGHGASMASVASEGGQPGMDGERSSSSPAAGPERTTRHEQALLARYGSRLRIALSVLGVAAVGAVVLIAHAGLGEALADLGGLSAGWALLAVGFEFATLMAITRYERRLFGLSGVRLPLHEAVPIVAADTALALSVSGGTLLGSGYARRRVTRAGADPALVSVVSWLALLLSAAVAGLVVTLATAQAGDPVLNGLSVVALLLAVAGLVCAVQRPGILAALRRRLGTRWRRAAAALDAVVERLERLRMTRRDWAVILFFGGWAAVVDAACLYACGQAVGAPASLSTALLGYAAVQTALCFPITPGALGIAEAALYLTLVGRHVPHEAALTWTLAYRLLSFWAVLLVGWTAFLVLRRSDRGRAAFSEALGAAEEAPLAAEQVF
jgi:uncharacterized membrane protein YbhN (UPF0104 family)